MKNSKLFNAIQEAFKAECENDMDFSPIRFCVKTSNSYAWLKLNPTCLNGKKIMEKVNKNYPCEVPTNIDRFLTSEYGFDDYYCDCIEFKEEASNAKKQAMKKNTDKTMIKYLISNKRSKKCFVSIRENYSYITDSYAIFKAKTENIISVINDVCNCNITKENNDYTFYNKILHEGKNIDLVEVFERFKKHFNALYTMEETQNTNFKTDKSSVNNNFVTLHHAYFNVLDENIISKAKKNGFDMDKVCVSLSEKHNKMIGFLKNNEVVLMCCSVCNIKEETQYISAYTEEEKSRLVDFEEIALSAHFCNENRNESLCILGRDTSNKPVYLDLNNAIHVLIAGATGSGKSCMMNSIISSLMMNNTKETASFLLIDPKRVEFFDYCDSDMLYGGEVIQNAKQAINALSALVEEMNKRFWILESQKKRSYMEFRNPSTMKQIFVCIDELSFLLLENKKEVEDYISKIGMLGRAAGIHLILATQHPDRKTITGTIQANIPTVIGLTTRKAVDSRMIIGDDSLTKLHGNGEAILVDGLNVIQFQGSYIKQETIQDIVNKELYAEGMKNKHASMNVTKVSFCSPSAIDNSERSKYIC